MSREDSIERMIEVFEHPIKNALTEESPRSSQPTHIKVPLKAHQLAIIETLDNGKPIRETRDIDIPLVVRHFYHHAGWATTWQESFPNYTSLGVIGQTIPWNLPLYMFAW